MPAETHNVCRGGRQRSWPALFTKKREFDGKAENTTYIEFVRSQSSDGKEAENEDEYKGEDEEYGENVDQDEHESDEAVEQDGNNESEEQNPVKVFMEGCVGEQRKLKYHDQVDQVLGFCDCNVGIAQKHVALLDDRCKGDCSEPRGYSRLYLGPLTAPQLQAELERTRFKDDDNDFNEKVDAERRLIYITDLDPWSIHALLTTAPRSQAQALKDLIYRHLMREISLGVDIPSQGFRNFTLHCNIPYYVFKSHKDLCRDHRKKANGEPLRHSWKFPSNSREAQTPESTGISDCVYEAHISITITGIDHSVWAAYGIVDTYFDTTQDSVDVYHQQKGKRGRNDPLGCGYIDGDHPIWTPREYFLKVVEIRIQDVVREWSAIVRRMQMEIKQSRKSSLSLLSDDPKTRRNRRRDATTWISDIIGILRDFKEILSRYDLVWEAFNRQAIDCFVDAEPSASSAKLSNSLEAIETSFGELRGFLRTVEGMIEELAQDYPQGLRGQLLLENNEAALSQQICTNRLQVLTYLSMVFFPLMVASSLFSMQGVLPFTSNFRHFTLVLVALTIFIIATMIVHFNWELCQQKFGSLFSVWKQRPSVAMKRPFFFGECRTTSDIEAQVEQGGISSNGFGAGHQLDLA